MKQCTKKSLIAVLAIIFSMGSVSSTKTIPRDISIGATALVGTVLAIHDDELVGCKAIKWLAEKTDTDSRDLVNSSMLATILWGSSYFIENKAIKNVLRAATIATPIIGMVTPKKMWEKVSKLPLVKDYFSFCSSLRALPLIGTYFTCKDKTCEGICNNCKLTRFYQALPAVFGGGYVAKELATHCVQKMKEAAKNKKPKRQNPGEPGNSDPDHDIDDDNLCTICNENELDITLPCGNNHRFCKECTRNWFYQRYGNELRYFDFNKKCPLCRGDVYQHALERQLFE